tara:strand:+ start:431 stop:1522 length:1092 start_codon:yes stop_codon:yes gene_type:complete
MNVINILNNNNLIFLYGSVYSGKYNLFKDLYNLYSIYEYNYLDFYYNNDWNKKLEYILTTTSNFFFKDKPKLLIIREVEIISFKKIKTVLKILGLKKNKITNDIKIILIGSGKCIKQKKDYDFFKLIEYNDCNYEYLKKMKYLKKNNFNQNAYKHNNFNIELYDNVKKVFFNNLVIENFYDIYHNYKILLPLLIHENYKNILKKNIKSQKNLKKCILKISDNILFSEQIDEYIFNRHKWNLQKIYSIISCQYISYIVNDFKLKTKRTDIKIEYTKILTKNSTKSSNMRNYINIFNKIMVIHNFDYTLIKFINKILLIHLTNNKVNYEKQLLNLGYIKNDFLKIIRNTNEYFYINNLDEIKKLI